MLNDYLLSSRRRLHAFIGLLGFVFLVLPVYWLAKMSGTSYEVHYGRVHPSGPNSSGYLDVGLLILAAVIVLLLIGCLIPVRRRSTGRE